MPTAGRAAASAAAASNRNSRRLPVCCPQAFSAGVGNWVADEVLYQARMHPEQPVSDLSQEQVAAVHAALDSVIQLAVSVDADSHKFPRDWLFHYRWTGKKASSINGGRIEFLTVGGRTSAFVPSVQRLVSNGAANMFAVAAAAEDGSQPGTSRAKGKANAAGRKRKAEAAEAESDPAVVAAVEAAAKEVVAEVAAVNAAAKAAAKAAKAPPRKRGGKQDVAAAEAPAASVEAAPAARAALATRRAASAQVAAAAAKAPSAAGKRAAAAKVRLQLPRLQPCGFCCSGRS